MAKKTITPHLFEGHLILALDIGWTELFNKIPKFSMYIDKSLRLHLVSEDMMSLGRKS